MLRSSLQIAASCCCPQSSRRSGGGRRVARRLLRQRCRCHDVTARGVTLARGSAAALRQPLSRGELQQLVDVLLCWTHKGDGLFGVRRFGCRINASRARSRKIVVGRKNWLFYETDTHAEGCCRDLQHHRDLPAPRRPSVRVLRRGLARPLSRARAHWLATRARLDLTQLERPQSYVTVPASPGRLRCGASAG